MEDTVRVVGVADAGDAARVTLKDPSDPTGPVYLAPLKLTVTVWAATYKPWPGGVPRGRRGCGLELEGC